MEKHLTARVLLYSPDLSGHRAAFLEFASALLDGENSGATRIARDPRPALFLMIEDDVVRFVLLGFWRSLLGRRTVGFLFRPLPAIDGKSLRLRMKRAVLRALRATGAVRILTIIPIPLAPRIEKIASGWIYDLQLWDMGTDERALVTRLRGGDTVPGVAGDIYARIRERAGQRKVLVALGAQSRSKGFSVLADLGEIEGTEDWLIVTLGGVKTDQEPAKARLEAKGHLVVDRFVADEELVAAYAAADAVWCLYDSVYDQASGILGRALQFGVAPIVREGSLSHKLCIAESVPHLAAQDVGACAVALNSLPVADPVQGEYLAQKFREASLATLADHLFSTSTPR